MTDKVAITADPSCLILMKLQSLCQIQHSRNILQIKYSIYKIIRYNYCSVDGVVVIIMACHAIVLGSIPSRRNRKNNFKKLCCIHPFFLSG